MGGGSETIKKTDTRMRSREVKRLQGRTRSGVGGAKQSQSRSQVRGSEHPRERGRDPNNRMEVASQKRNKKKEIKKERENRVT